MSLFMFWNALLDMNQYTICADSFFHEFVIKVEPGLQVGSSFRPINSWPVTEDI